MYAQKDFNGPCEANVTAYCHPTQIDALQLYKTLLMIAFPNVWEETISFSWTYLCDRNWFSKKQWSEVFDGLSEHLFQGLLSSNSLPTVLKVFKSFLHGSQLRDAVIRYIMTDGLCMRERRTVRWWIRSLPRPLVIPNHYLRRVFVISKSILTGAKQIHIMLLRSLRSDSVLQLQYSPVLTSEIRWDYIQQECKYVRETIYLLSSMHIYPSVDNPGRLELHGRK